MLSNRELASLTIIVVFIIWVALLDRYGNKLGEALIEIVKAFANWRVLLSITVYVAYVSGIVYLAYNFDLWSPSILKETLLWVAVVGFPMLLNADNIRDGKKHFKSVVRETLGLSALVALYFGLISFAFHWELILQVSTTFLVMISHVAKSEERTQVVGKASNLLLGAIGIFLIIATARTLKATWHVIDWRTTLLELGISVWLPISLVPFIYCFAFFMRCESILKLLPIFNKRSPLKLRINIAVLLGFCFSIRYAASFKGKWRQRLATSKTFRNSNALMKEYRHSVSLEAKADHARTIRLKQFAGNLGVDGSGRQLDRRTFTEVQSVLTELAYVQMGQHRNQTHYYRDDALEFADQKGLPPTSKIVLKVSPEKQRWFAWTRAISGWVFAVGAGPDIDLIWRYDGAEPPITFPEQATGDKWATEGVNGADINWD